MDEMLALLLRKEAFDRLCEGMSDEDRRAMLRQLTERNSQQQIMAALEKQGSQLKTLTDHIARHSWLSDFGANVAGNAAYDAALWVIRRLVQTIK